MNRVLSCEAVGYCWIFNVCSVVSEIYEAGSWCSVIFRKPCFWIIAQLPPDFQEIQEKPGHVPTWWRKQIFFLIFWIIKGTELGPSQWRKRPGSLFPGLLKILRSHGRAVSQFFSHVLYFVSIISFQQKHLKWSWKKRWQVWLSKWSKRKGTWCESMLERQTLASLL